MVRAGERAVEGLDDFHQASAAWTRGQLVIDIAVVIAARRSGSATLAHALTKLGLVDEYRLIVHPVVLGKGKRLFGEENGGTDLELVESRKAGPDVLLLIYRPAKPAAA